MGSIQIFQSADFESTRTIEQDGFSYICRITHFMYDKPDNEK